MIFAARLHKEYSKLALCNLTMQLKYHMIAPGVLLAEIYIYASTNASISLMISPKEFNAS